MNNTTLIFDSDEMDIRLSEYSIFPVQYLLLSTIFILIFLYRNLIRSNEEDMAIKIKSRADKLAIIAMGRVREYRTNFIVEKNDISGECHIHSVTIYWDLQSELFHSV